MGILKAVLHELQEIKKELQIRNEKEFKSNISIDGEEVAKVVHDFLEDEAG